MAPKKVKQEPGAKCIKDAIATMKAVEEAKKQTSDFEYKMRKAPREVKQFYEKGLKYQKTAKSSDKQEFIDKVLEGDFKADYFKRCLKIQKVNEHKEEQTWMSWKQVTDLDGEALVKAQIACGAIETRKHPRLNHDHESVQALPDELKLEYQKIQDFLKYKLQKIKKNMNKILTHKFQIISIKIEVHEIL
jgi:hypothetical protein